jgi:hypothetical protein
VYDGRVLRALFLVMTLAACADPQPPPVQKPVVTDKRTSITPRSKLPDAIRPLLPAHGVYIAGGGLVSSAWRVVVDYDNKTIYGGTAKASNAPSFGKMTKEATSPLSPRNEVHLTKLAEDVWREAPPKDPPDPTADYDEIFVVLDGDDAFYLQGFGPIRRPVAAQAIIEFRAAAGL